ncbi:MAG TPA: hypothetical protein PLB41_08510 [Rubrivivax sp.]|nr:hypothetical protein [Rubrivivax sp.]HPO18214.1 hypothetical protein [Rubrivivax sp.]
MKPTLLLATIGVLAAAASASALGAGGAPAPAGVWASAHCSGDAPAHRDDRSAGACTRGMQAVPHSAGPGDAAYGWRYFTDPAAHRAVVISPQGEYYYSRGKGLWLVAMTQPGS